MLIILLWLALLWVSRRLIWSPSSTTHHLRLKEAVKPLWRMLFFDWWHLIPTLNARSCRAFGSYHPNSKSHLFKESNMSEWASTWSYDCDLPSLPDTSLSSEMWKLMSEISGTVRLCESCNLEHGLGGRAGHSEGFCSLCITARSSVTKCPGFCFVRDLAAYFCFSPLCVLW